jgi:hypothetical protein
VTERDDVGTKFTTRPLQKRVPRGATGVFEGTPFKAGKRPDVRPVDRQRPAQRFGEAGAKRFVGVGGGAAELMIEVREPDQPAFAHSVE